MGRNQNFEIVFGGESDLCHLGFSIFGFLFHLPFFSFSLLFAAVLDLLLGLLAVKKLLRKCQVFHGWLSSLTGKNYYVNGDDKFWFAKKIIYFSSVFSRAHPLFLSQAVPVWLRLLIDYFCLFCFSTPTTEHEYECW